MPILEKKLAHFGIRPGLIRIKRLMKKLRNPEKKLRVILVAGTNGKGSVTSYIASILKENGHKVGAYYSPHLFRYNERFKINGKEIPNNELNRYEKLILKYVKNNSEITLFEALTAIAYRYFADEKCDFAIMECGMGGKYDATNIAREEAAIITNVDFDHTEYLGSTIESIAKEKFGIVKNKLLFTAANAESLTAISKEAEKKNTRISALGKDFFISKVEADVRQTKFNYIGKNFYYGLRTCIPGSYQAKNAALAIACAEHLGIEENAIRNGIWNAKNHGRMQLLGKNPVILADAAHNLHAVKELVANLYLFDYDKLICVFGVMKDKNWQEMLRLLGQHCDFIITTQINDARAADCEELANFAGRFTKAISIRNVKTAVSNAKKHADKKDMILICGSIHMLSEAM